MVGVTILILGKVVSPLLYQSNLRYIYFTGSLEGILNTRTIIVHGGPWTAMSIELRAFDLESEALPTRPTRPPPPSSRNGGVKCRRRKPVDTIEITYVMMVIYKRKILLI